MSEVAVAAPPADPLLNRGPFLAVLSQGLPLAFGLASHAIINLVDLALIGRLGDDAVQSAHVASTWNFVPMIVGNCVSTALLARLSRRLGDGDAAGARGLNVRAQWFMLWLGLLIGVVTAVPAGWFVDGTGLAGHVRDDAVHYLIVSNLGCLPMFVLMQTTAAMRAAGEAMVPFGLLLLANVLNLALNLVLLFGWPAAGIPAIGVAGAAYGSVSARTVAAVLAVGWLARRTHVLTLRGNGVARRREPVVVPLLQDSWPQALQIGLRASVVLVLTILVQQRFGDAATVSLGVATRFDTLVLFSSLGFANAATAYAGRAIVVGWSGRARLAGLHAALQSGVFGALWVALFNAEPQLLLGWCRPDASDELHRLTVLYFATAAWGQVFGAIALGAIGAVYGSGRMIAPLLVDLVGFGCAAALLWRVAGGAADLRDIYLALVWGMVAVAVCQLMFVAVGRWARPL